MNDAHEIERRSRFQKFTVADILKIIMILFGLVAGWFRMESRLEGHAQEMGYLRERIVTSEVTQKGTREEFRGELERINEKLDRLIEGRSR